jgi:Fur family transcriptional regulator, stress-responsive regulator
VWRVDLPGVTDADLIRQAGRHESPTAGDHHHIVCRRCGTVADVDRVAGHPLCLEPAAGAGFAIDKAQVTFWGLCPTCQASAPS